MAGIDRQAQRSASNDLFKTYLHSASDDQAEQIASRLVSEHAAPLISEIVRFKLRGSNRSKSDGEDLQHDILVSLLSRLRRLRVSREGNPIQNFRDYVAVVTYNACKQYFGRYIPERETVLLEDQSAVHSGEPEQEAVADRFYLERVWAEIKNLPVKQRAALLLSLRDENENGMLVVLPANGIATARQIAEVLEMQLLQLATLWKDLPLDDLRISELLGVTRQQVINLRKCARERLGRRFS